MDGEGATEAGGGAGVIAVWLDRHRQKYECATRHPFVLSIREGTVDLSSFKRWLGRCGSVGHNQMSYLKRKKCALPGKIIDWRPGVHSIMSERAEMAIFQMQELKDMCTVAYGQDYIFVREFVPFLASVLLKACKESDNGMDMEVILGGLASLHDELSWFKKEASKWDVHLAEVVPQRANRDYCSFLHSLTISEMDYTTAIVAFWAIETVYQESFALCLEDGSRTPAELLGTCERWGNTGFRRYCQSLREIAERRLQKAPDGVLRKAGGAFTQVLEHEVNFWNMSSGDT